MERGGEEKNRLPNKRHGKLPKGEVASLFFTEAYKSATIRALRVFCHFFSVYLCIELIKIANKPFQHIYIYIIKLKRSTTKTLL